MNDRPDSPDKPNSRTTASAEVRLRHKAGLHARPAVALVKLAKKFSADIDLALAPDGPWVDAKSLVKVMATKAPRDAMLYLHAVGDDAEAALLALVTLIEQDFPDDG